MAALSAALSLLIGEEDFLAPFIVTAVIALLIGQLFYWFEGKKNGHAPGEIVATMALAWLIIPVLGSIPFWWIPLLDVSPSVAAVFASPMSGLFEFFSGFTSTGLTMVSTPSELPMSLQWWRTLSEWIGGVGIALLMLTVLAPSRDAEDLFDAELNKPFASGIREAARWIWWIYGGLTVMAIVAFALLGMPLRQALNHGMTAVATGGFSVTDDSFAAYSRPIQTAAMVFMLAGAVSFAAYHEALQERSPWLLLRRPPVIALFAGVAVASFIIWLSRWQFDDRGELWDILFQTVSSLATAGFSTVELSAWHSSDLAVLIACMIVGGAAGATTGGLKLDRVILILRGVGWRMLRYWQPSADRWRELDGEQLPDDDARLRVEAAATLAAVWLAALLLGCLCLAPFVDDGRSFTEIMFECASALGSVGLSTGITGDGLDPLGKITLIILMWIGRLEIFAALALVYLPWVIMRRSDDDPSEAR